MYTCERYAAQQPLCTMAAGIPTIAGRWTISTMKPISSLLHTLGTFTQQSCTTTQSAREVAQQQHQCPTQHKPQHSSITRLIYAARAFYSYKLYNSCTTVQNQLLRDYTKQVKILDIVRRTTTTRTKPTFI